MNARVLLETLNRMRNDPAFAPYLEHLREERAHLREQLETLDPRHVPVVQGEARRITHILQEIEGATKKLELLSKGGI